MTAEGWHDLVLYVIREHQGGDDAMLTLLVRLLYEQDQAKATIQRAGYGCTGMPWPELANEVSEATRRQCPCVSELLA